ncbi:hypothetical protein EON83_29940 [bacterium]|nr:MAG: hypothetical protein EON83_29940 [bacterium]
MAKLRAIAMMIASLVLSNGILWFVLSENMSAGIYPVNADSVGIPIMEAATVSFAILLCVALTIALPNRTRIWRIAQGLPAVISSLLSLLLSASWLSPNHYLVASAFFGLALACIWSWWLVRKPIGTKTEAHIA